MDKYYLILTETMYDKLVSKYGDNCGFDTTKVVVYRGYPKFN